MELLKSRERMDVSCLLACLHILSLIASLSYGPGIPWLGNGATHSGQFFLLEVTKVIPHRHVHRPTRSRQFLTETLYQMIPDSIKFIIKTNSLHITTISQHLEKLKLVSDLPFMKE